MESIYVFGENTDEKVTTPESSHLFIVNKQVQKSDEEKSEIFHSVVEKLLYIMRRVSPDLETAI